MLVVDIYFSEFQTKRSVSLMSYVIVG